MKQKRGNCRDDHGKTPRAPARAAGGNAPVVDGIVGGASSPLPASRDGNAREQIRVKQVSFHG
ncbi:MAG: hypothetical protein LBF09_03330 [Odoribacteraceae bacterium]|nr:hypothetical protein [Odoribacteraceae bacterium]